MSHIHTTILYDRHVSAGAQMVEFGGWNMPMHYPVGILQEHLATRKSAGLFDVSHMGRFVFRGERALAFLQHVLSNNAAALEPGKSQYTIIPNEQGGALDDAYLYRFTDDEYLLVVNAANRAKDWEHFQRHLNAFEQVEMLDQTHALAMISLQGPLSKEIVSNALTAGALPEPLRNSLGIVEINGARVRVARTGYTGEPICFEFFVESDDAVMLWDLLVDRGAQPVGLGARDTLRLEAGLPLYGHELGLDPEDREIPIFAIPLGRLAVSFTPLKGDFVGKQALRKQFEALKRIMAEDYALMRDLPRRVKAVAVMGKGIAREGSRVFAGERHVGYVTSGTMLPNWTTEGAGLLSQLGDDTAKRAICLALVDSDLRNGDLLDIDVRGRRIQAVIVPYHVRSEAPPYVRVIPYTHFQEEKSGPAAEQQGSAKVATLLKKTIANTLWRQRECVNLIPSEQTPSCMARLLSIMDPEGRYAEHKPMKAFCEAEVFYYQGTDFIADVEALLQDELCRYLGCRDVEARLLSGQMANTAVFSAMVDYVNRADRKIEQRRLRSVMNNHIIRGGHLSAQPMGALRDFVARDPHTEKSAVVNFPVLAGNPYKLDVKACGEMIAEHRPELIILGKSMVLYPEPVAEIRGFIDELGLECVLMYDMAHVLGLVGPLFQEPFKEGADLVTGSTHKTFFGTQRGIIAGNYPEDDVHFALWQSIQSRAFPGSVSNHHLGTLLGLLAAAYEMNAFKADYQRNVLANAKGFALALKDCGLDVAGDPEDSYTQTHQVIVNVGYAKGPEIARRLEENNIVVNYQAAPDEEGFTASGSLRLGVAEMTRFGMEIADFQEVAQLMRDVIVDRKNVKATVKALRQRFCDMHYCFSGSAIDELMQQLHQLIK